MRHGVLIQAFQISLIALLTGTAPGAEEPNFYTDGANFYNDAPSARKTPAPTSKKDNSAEHQTKAKPKPPSATPPPSKAADTAKKTPAPPSETKTTARPMSTPQPPARATAARESTGTVTLAKPAASPRKQAPPKSVPRRLDPYGLGAIFSQPWDLLHYVIQPEEALRYRAESARLRASRLARTLGRLTDSISRRQKNARNAAIAAYLLGQASDDPPYPGSDFTLPHLLVVETTLRSDSRDLQREIVLFEILRSAENSAAERLRHLQKKRSDSTAKAFENLEEAQSDPFALTRSPGEENRRLTEALLHERAPTETLLSAIQAAESSAARPWRRFTLASLAPALPDAPPEGWPTGPETAPKDVPVPRPRVSSSSKDPAPPADTTILIRTGADRLVRAAADGSVVFAGPWRGVGNLIVIEHPRGLFSVYEDMQGVHVAIDQAVRAGQTIGEAAGSAETGEGWIKFQVRRGVDVVAPAELLGAVEAATIVAPGVAGR